MKHKKVKQIFFYNAIVMPHSILLHNILLERGYEIKFWYYKDISTIYPWKLTNYDPKYFIYKNIRNLYNVLKDWRNSDLIIITGWHTWVHILLLIFSKIFNKKSAIWVDVPEPLNKSFLSCIKRKLARLPKYTLVTGQIGCEKIIDIFKLKKENIFDFPYLSALFDEEKINDINKKRKKNIQKGVKIKLLISNRFIERKGYSTVFESFKQIEPHNMNKLDVTILGNGPEYEHYKSKSEKYIANIKFCNWVEYENYLEYITNTDIYLHASFHEPFGIPPIDAMHCGKLVIASNGVMSCVDRIINGINGYIYSAKQPQELSNILLNVIENPCRIYEIGEKAKDSSQKYNPEFNVKTIEKILNENASSN